MGGHGEREFRLNAKELLKLCPMSRIRRGFMEDIQSLIWKQTRRIRKDSGEGEGEGEGNSRQREQYKQRQWTGRTRKFGGN